MDQNDTWYPVLNKSALIICTGVKFQSSFEDCNTMFQNWTLMCTDVCLHLPYFSNQFYFHSHSEYEECRIAKFMRGDVMNFLQLLLT